ncbi:MAG TPA: RyR domain-containing protein [Thermoanaerobaculia bacterium]|jgi:ryanodine receptor 2|nr:RyR domain-containing protein [Thermoanaerobaculia bacterium]
MIRLNGVSILLLHMAYTPKPIDTSGVELEPEIAALTEQLARNTHDLWAQQRISDGWTHGTHRDDHAKKHPGLISYDELPNSEREYDRRTAIGALKAITALGYQIDPAPRLTRAADRSFEECLEREIRDSSRKDDFDMNDEREIAMADCHPRLADALQWLAGTVGKEWAVADGEANRSQSRHRDLSRIAIVAGTAAIMFAILQLAAHAVTVPSINYVASKLEAIAASAALLAVGVGWMASMNRRWLAQRHRAECLRMFKFCALDRLWSYGDEPWKRWVGDRLREIPPSDSHVSAEWSEENAFEDEKARPFRSHDDGLTQALIAYYRVKRLGYQRQYFDARSKAYAETMKPWHHISLWLFFASAICVLIHFGLEWGAGWVVPVWERRLDDAGIWFVALAAIIPVVGAGIRAWFGAFERTRSATLYKEKLSEIDRANDRLDEHAHDLAAIRRDIASTEQFLKQEHREWLRLLHDAEWFL